MTAKRNPRKRSKKIHNPYHPSRNTPRTVPKQNQNTQLIATKTFIGPIPDPETLDAYDKIVPGAATQIIGMAQKEQTHRHSQESRGLTAFILERRIGQLFGLIVALGALGAGVFAALKGSQIAGSVFGVSGIASIVASYFRGSDNK